MKRRAGDPLAPSSSDPDALAEVERETNHVFGPPPGRTSDALVEFNGRRAAIETPPGFNRATRPKVVAEYGKRMRDAYDALSKAKERDPAGRYVVTQNAQGYILVEGA